jgi:hypothetical protein
MLAHGLCEVNNGRFSTFDQSAVSVRMSLIVPYLASPNENRLERRRTIERDYHGVNDKAFYER